MEAYAVLETGGKQYRVKVNDTLRVERLNTQVGEKVEFAPVLAVSDGKTLQVGAPTAPGSKVIATVTDHIRAKKVVSFKKKRRKGYSRKKGHRQEQTALKVDSIIWGQHGA